MDVHVAPDVDPATAQAVLADAEAVMDGLERIGVALPLPDGDRGGTPSFDLYFGFLPNSVCDPAETCTGNHIEAQFEAEVDALSFGGMWDRASAFGQVSFVGDAVTRRRAVAQVIAEACVYGAKADHPVGFVRAMGASLARRATGLPLAVWDVREFQQEPSRAWWSDDARSPAAQRGAAVVLDAMATHWDNDRASFLRGLTEAPVQRTPPGWSRFWNEPDVMEVLRRVTRDEPRGFGGALLTAASERSLVGTAADPTGNPIDASLAALPARVVRWGELPAWTLATGIAPTGSASMEVTLGDAPPQGAIGVWVHGSPYHRWMASVLRVADDGRVIGTIDSELITDGEWAARVDALEHVRRLVLVVVSAGDGELDPDGAPVRDGWVAMNVAVSRDAATGR